MAASGGSHCVGRKHRGPFQGPKLCDGTYCREGGSASAIAAGAAYGPSIQLYFAELNRTKWISTATENRNTPCATSTRRGSKIVQILEKGCVKIISSLHLESRRVRQTGQSLGLGDSPGLHSEPGLPLPYSNVSCAGDSHKRPHAFFVRFHELAGFAAGES